VSNQEQGRHPFRFLLKFLLFAGLLTAIARVMASKKAEFAGLTDSEARAKFEEKLGPWIGEEKAAEVADQVVPKLKDAGLLEPKAAANGMDKAAGKAADAVKGTAKKARDSVKNAAGKTADKVADTADSASDAIGDAVDEAVEKIEEVSKKTRGR